MKRTLLIALGVWLLACGSGEDSEQRANPPVLRVVFAADRAYVAQAATEATAPPITLVFRFLGPDGAIEQRVAYETGRLALDELRVGTWQVEAEGLDGSDLVTWQAGPALFEIREDSTTELDLVFSPL